MEGTVTISKDEYYSLLLDREELNRLGRGGVRNWEWYEDSLNLNPITNESWDDFKKKLKISIAAL